MSTRRVKTSDRVTRMEEAVRRHLRYSLARSASDASPRDLLAALSLAARDDVVERMIETEARYVRADAKRVYYLSIEFLMGRALGNTLDNLGLSACAAEVARGLGVDLEELSALEPDPALGNGGLGRLAACFLDSMATLGVPGHGYGINYEFGLFRQEIEHGHQREKPDHWLVDGTPWQIPRLDEACVVPVYGRLEHGEDAQGHYNPMWLDRKVLIGIPHDMPVVGYGGSTVNVLRLYSARASDEFDIEIFNEGDYIRAVEQKIASETISKVLYPSDAVEPGRELRLVQEYFLVACALRDMVKRYRRGHTSFAELPDRVAIQLNDTHPALAVAELMRVLVDEHEVDWSEASDLTRRTLGYTNHTLLPEALEKWPGALMDRVLPRHLQIIYEINRRFLREVANRWPDDPGRVRRMSIIEEGETKQVRMAHLAVVGSHSVNGVAALHSDLVRRTLFADFHALWPERFSNKTNGVTQRRWLRRANPGLAGLLGRTIGDKWIVRLDALRDLERYAADAAFQEMFRAVKRQNKERLARTIHERARLTVDPDSLFDVHVKRIHEYKRQLLNVMHIVHQYLVIVEDGRTLAVPKTYVFAGKAAPGYVMAKLIIRLINGVAEVVNADPRTRGQLAVVFLPDYGVSLAERIIPAAELSEQISTAGKEASGTGNMKLALNGALTIGTLDGANVEIQEEVGGENIFIFGLTAPEVEALRVAGRYDPREIYAANETAHRVVDAIASNRFCPGEPGVFRPLADRLLQHGEEYVHLADFEAYLDAHRRTAVAYRDPARWTRMAILNVARMGKFSSDRTIAEYASDIWRCDVP
jgi:glycogen phosphorylase